MKKKECRFGAFSKILTALRHNNRGSILATVVVIGAALFMITMALLSTVSNTANVSESVDNSDNAYLAARSGLTMLVDKGADTNFAQKMVASIGTTPINLDMGDLGTCDVYITDLGDTDDGAGNVTKLTQVECVGHYEGKDFRLTRYMTFKRGVTVNNAELKTQAYVHYGDGDVTIDGGIEGDVTIIGNGHIQNDKANDDHMMHNVTCTNELVLTNSRCVYESVALGKYLVLTNAEVYGTSWVGCNKLDASNQFTSELNDDIYCYATDAVLHGPLRCEGVTVINDGEINTDHGTNGSQEAVVSGGDLYLGYKVNNYTTYKSGDSYKVAGSTYNTAAGLSSSNGGQKIYGDVYAKGDVHIAASAEIYGNIVCGGDVYIEGSMVKLTGNIYAAGDVNFTSGFNMGYDEVFPNATVVFAGGNINNNAANSADLEAAVTFKAHQSTVPLVSKFSNANFVGAADYFKSKYESVPKPTTHFPADLATAPVLIPPTQLVDVWWKPGYSGPYPIKEEQLSGDIEITSDTVIDKTLNLDGHKLYINTAALDQDIDIKLTGTANISTGNNGGIYINDNAGQNQVRFFMEDGSQLHLNSGWGPDYTGIYVVSDASKDIAVSNLPTTAYGVGVDIQKMPQLYFFGEEGKTNITLDVATYGYIPGYVLMPYVDVTTNSNAHCYVSGTPLGTKPNGDPFNPEKDNTQYPFFYGMLMCNSLNFQQGTNTFIKYDDRLEEVPDPLDPTHMVKSEPRKMFDKALSRDSVMAFASAAGAGAGGGLPTATWVVDRCY